MTQAAPPGIVAALRELIDAVDRRVPHLQRAGEVRVAQIAAALRGEAASRLEAMGLADRDPAGRDPAEHDSGVTTPES